MANCSFVFQKHIKSTDHLSKHIFQSVASVSFKSYRQR